MAAATATAEVSEPPRPSVVMWPSGSMPWKPVTMTTRPASRSARMRASSMELMRAFVKDESVRTGTCQPA
ncbi:hypothetical protein G6F22_021095 [Rhizopus arrhizus]|nr:hypothetical protein G6F22_021095 [Rhizopus arrhizus]